MKCMPESKETALSAVQLFSATTVTSMTIGKKALKELFDAGQCSGWGKVAAAIRTATSQTSARKAGHPAFNFVSAWGSILC
jgi:hypothetical protein